MPSDNVKLTTPYFAYSLYIGRAIVCSPSNLLFTALFRPSRYESKLWDIRYALHRDAKVCDRSVATTNFWLLLSGQLKDLQDRYYANLSTPFERALTNLLTEDGVFQCAAPHKYQHYFCQSVDWELVNVQPMRYMWNTTEPFTLYALLFTVGASAKSCHWYSEYLRSTQARGSETRLGVFQYASLLLQRLQFKSLLGHRLPWHTVWWYPLAVVNLLNFVRMSSTHKLPSQTDASESENFRAAVDA
jgi:hypothetical protein